MSNNAENIKQLIINSETNLEKVNNLLVDKEISKLTDSENELIKTLLDNLKELGKDEMKENQYYIDFCSSCAEELYLLNIKDIIKNGSEILKTMKKYYKDLFLTKPIKIVLGKSKHSFKRRK